MPYSTGWNYELDRQTAGVALVHMFFLALCSHLNYHISIVAVE